MQNLVKQNETTIESLTIENQLQKANAKEYEKKLATIQKENEELMRHLCLVRDVAFGKSKYIIIYTTYHMDNALPGDGCGSIRLLIRPAEYLWPETILIFKGLAPN